MVYQLASMPSTVVQIAGGANEIGDDTGTSQLTGFTAGTQAKATTTYIVADGQQLGAKSATFDGTTVPDAGFTGSDPQAVPRYSQGNLWDTTTADVSSSVKPGDTSAALSITSATAGGYYDCVVEEAVAEVFEGLAAGSRPRALAIQEMILELQQADRAIAGSEGRDSLLVE